MDKLFYRHIHKYAVHRTWYIATNQNETVEYMQWKQLNRWCTRKVNELQSHYLFLDIKFDSITCDMWSINCTTKLRNPGSSRLNLSSEKYRIFTSFQLNIQEINKVLQLSPWWIFNTAISALTSTIEQSICHSSENISIIEN